MTQPGSYDLSSMTPIPTTTPSTSGGNWWDTPSTSVSTIEGDGPNGWGKYVLNPDGSLGAFIVSSIRPSSGGAAPQVNVSTGGAHYTTMYGPEGYGTYETSTGVPILVGAKASPTASNDANGDGFDDKTGLPTMGGQTASMIGGKLYFAGQRINPDGSPMTAAQIAQADGTVGGKTATIGGSLYEQQPDGSWKLAVQGPQSSSGGGGGGGGSSPFTQSVHSGGYNNTTTSIKDITPAAAAAELALAGAQGQNQASHDAMTQAIANADRLQRVTEARAQFELNRYGQIQQDTQNRIAMIKEFIDAVSSTDPISFAAYLAAGGDNLQNAIATQGTAVSDRSIAGAAALLRQINTQTTPPTWEQATAGIGTPSGGLPSTGSSTGPQGSGAAVSSPSPAAPPLTPEQITTMGGNPATAGKPGFNSLGLPLPGFDANGVYRGGEGVASADNQNWGNLTGPQQDMVHNQRAPGWYPGLYQWGDPMSGPTAPPSAFGFPAPTAPTGGLLYGNDTKNTVVPEFNNGQAMSPTSGLTYNNGTPTTAQFYKVDPTTGKLVAPVATAARGIRMGGLPTGQAQPTIVGDSSSGQPTGHEELAMLPPGAQVIPHEQTMAMMRRMGGLKRATQTGMVGHAADGFDLGFGTNVNPFQEYLNSLSQQTTVAPTPAYVAPTPTYVAPAPTYTAPAPTTVAPAPYVAPVPTTTAAPATTTVPTGGLPTGNYSGGPTGIPVAPTGGLPTANTTPGTDTAAALSAAGYSTPNPAPDQSYEDYVRGLRSGSWNQSLYLNPYDVGYFGMDPIRRDISEKMQQSALGIPQASTQFAAQKYRLGGLPTSAMTVTY